MNSLQFYFLLFALPILVNISPLHAATKYKAQYNDEKIKLTLLSRSPEQIAAFYEGRGFSKKMINKLKQQCFITVGLHNKSSQILWLDLSNWYFTNHNGEIRRLNRKYWKSVWKTMNIPLAHQSTFRWTLLPEVLDFRTNEFEGGNIILPASNQPFTLRAQFATKADKSGKAINIQLNNIQCVHE